MLEEVFQDVYTKFKLHFYQNVFQRFATREATLTTVESFCMEGIMAMGEPTIAEFSRMMGISTPNAAYKIGSLVKKGYVEKIQSTTDRREYFLRPTQKYIDYYSISYSYLHTVIERVRKRFPAEDCDKMEQMLSVISTELMPELDMPRGELSLLGADGGTGKGIWQAQLIAYVTAGKTSGFFRCRRSRPARCCCLRARTTPARCSRPVCWRPGPT